MEIQIKVTLGENQYKQKVELIRETNGSFTIVRHAASSRDETQYMTNLTRDMLKNIDLFFAKGY